jgi:hypothetical protein
MARGKNSTALFEVIHTAKRPPKASPSGGGIPAPKWWAKGGKGEPDGPTETPAPAGAETSGGTRRSWLAAARRSAEPAVDAISDREPTPDAAEAAEDVEAGDAAEADSDRDPATAPGKVVITRYYPQETPARSADPEPAAEDEPAAMEEPAGQPGTTAPSPDAGPTDERPSWSERRARVLAERSAVPSKAGFDPTADVNPDDLRSGSRPTSAPARPARRSAGPTPSAMRPEPAPPVALDRDAGEVRFRLSYGGAILAGVILLLVIVIAYLAGHATGGESAVDPTGSGRPSVARAGSGAPQPNDGAATHMMLAASPTQAPAADAGSAPAALVAAPTASAPTAPPAAADDVPFARQVGMLYVVVQCYPDRSTATRAATFLNRNGIPCDVVNGPSGFAMRDWCSVVGRQPFSRGDHTSAAQDYQRRIAALGPQFDKRAYNQFLPQLYAWKADSDIVQP